ncbi:MAG: hypothetical protein O8C61_11455 [Candidatus Methanoperedens sp.]|nr:hypothetical protein [Candidatus Methanoperedens sp.]
MTIFLAIILAIIIITGQTGRMINSPSQANDILDKTNYAPENDEIQH